jgi:quercetin dioxygenase-like cupin family protein
MNYPFSQQVIDNKIIRTFTPDVDIDELKWHQDLKDREVLIIESGGWEYQEDNNLPIKLKDGQKISIPKMTWHRVIKGVDKLVVEITEF